MAIKINTDFSGIAVNDAYARIEDFNGTKHVMDVQLFYYVSKQAADSEGDYFKREQYSFSPDASENSANYHKQAYEFVKSLPEFADAIDA